MRKVCILLAVLLTSCNRETPASILCKPFLEEYYETSIKIVSEEPFDSIYCPVPFYEKILEQYGLLKAGDTEKEAMLYGQFKKAETGPANMVGIRLKYKRGDDGREYDETFYFENGNIKYWGLNVSLDKAMIATKHERFIKSLNDK